MRKKIFKTLVIGVTLLFLGIAFQPAVSTNEIKKGEIEPEQYVFETVIDIANNQDVNDLLNQMEDEWKNNNNNYITWDFDNKEVFQQLLFKKPYLLYSMLFTESKLTQDYLDSSYNRGCELINILGEENVIEIVESVEIANPEILDDIYNYIIDDEELNERITTLSELNMELDESVPFRNYSTICKILLILFYVYLIRCAIVGFFSKFFESLPLISVIFDFLWFKNWEFAGVSMFIFQVIYDTLGCENPSPT